jgi:hypothetical protein
VRFDQKIKKTTPPGSKYDVPAAFYFSSFPKLGSNHYSSSDKHHRCGDYHQVDRQPFRYTRHSLVLLRPVPCAERRRPNVNQFTPDAEKLRAQPSCILLVVSGRWRSLPPGVGLAVDPGSEERKAASRGDQEKNETGTSRIASLSAMTKRE